MVRLLTLKTIRYNECIIIIRWHVLWTDSPQQLGIKVDNYFASEIDKYAIQIAKKNYPMVHVGDVTKLSYSDYRGCLVREKNL